MPSSTSREGWGGWAKKRLNILSGERAGQSGEWTEGETFYWGGGQSWTIPKGWHKRIFCLKWFRLQNIETPLNRWVGRCQTTHWSVVQFAHAGGIPGINALRWGWCVKSWRKRVLKTGECVHHQVKNHAYGVTGVRRVAVGSGINAVLRREKLALVRRK